MGAEFFGFFSHFMSGEPISKKPDEDLFLLWLKANGLSGFSYCRFRSQFSNHAVSKLKAVYSQQVVLNSLLLEEILNLYRHTRDILSSPMVILKGGALIQNLYPDIGERSLTDLDVFVTKEDLLTFQKGIETLGYEYVPQIIWAGNDFKQTYCRENQWGNRFYLDVHTQLFWRQNQNGPYCPNICKVNDSWVLAPMDQLIHLIANWAYQDTFVSLNKLVDIHLLLRQQPGLVRDPNFFVFLNRFGLNRAWEYVSWAMNYLSPLTEGAPIGRPPAFFSKVFLSDPQAKKFQYLYIKHRTKSLGRAIIYDWQWLRAYGLYAATHFLRET